MKTALMFGAFDNIHNGHRNAFEQLINNGFNIIICLAIDEDILRRKGRLPLQAFNQRKEALVAIKGIKQVIAGDYQEGAFSAINILKPDVIAIGYDQDELGRAIQDWMKINQTQIELISLEAHRPDKYKSSIIRERDIQI